MQGAAIRTAFLQYFHARGHEVVPSSPLVPGNDATLLFTNAGMVQFKDALAGRERRSCQRAVSTQKCLRAGGKHNDLENVGYTARHHTFFEMLGNFSFGAYFKEQAILYAWEFVTEVLGISAEKLWITVHDSDAEALALWRKLSTIPVARIRKLGDADNFWAMGDTGPCGPCSEIFYDHGPNVPGGPPGSADADGDRYVEIWNLVFVQYERTASGDLLPLQHAGVDTGMGLERVAAVLQGTHDNYRTDLFRGLIEPLAAAAGLSPAAAMAVPSIRVIADHIRAAAFLIAEAVLPDNEGRGYVLRRIIRRALRHGYQVGIKEAFFAPLIAPLVGIMGDAYPEIRNKAAAIQAALDQEEHQFRRTLDNGMRLLERALADLSGSEIPGELIFKMYDTYGFPADLTADIGRERNLSADMDGFAAAMEEQRQRARKASRFADDWKLRLTQESRFTGHASGTGSGRITALFRTPSGRDTDPQPTARLAEGEIGVVVLDETPFYAEAGGQVGDTGKFLAAGIEFLITDTQSGGASHLHYGRMIAGRLRLGDTVQAVVDDERRQRIRLNHSATHLLNAALRSLLGDHVLQKGSLVDDKHLRFDISHPRAIPSKQLRQIEELVNAQIRKNTRIETEIMGFDEACRRGVLALFGEKYGDRVRVLTMGDGFSRELCGGTHALRTGDIGIFRIVSESAIAAGIRRIEALTGEAALTRMNAEDDLAAQLQNLLRCGRGELPDKVSQLLTEGRQLKKELLRVQDQLAEAASSELADAMIRIGDVHLLARQVDGMDMKNMLAAADRLKKQFGPTVIVLASVQNGRIHLVVSVSDDLTERFPATDLLRHVGAQVGAKGGGQASLARGGGGDRPEALPAAMQSITEYLRAQLTSTPTES